MKYLNSKIYKLIDNTNGDIYIGSTCISLKKRLKKHKDNYYEYKKKDGRGSASYDIIKNNDYKIELLEYFPCKTKQELLNKEREYIENNKCINKNKPITTHQEKLNQKKEWQTINKNKLQEKRKVYRDKNRNKISETTKNYYEANKAKWNNYNKGSREKIQCDICNTTICRDSLWRHKKTPKCKNYKKE